MLTQVRAPCFPSIEPLLLTCQFCLAANHYSHVTYPDELPDESLVCPSTHPVRLPEVFIFIEYKDYPGGHHELADGKEKLHFDYMNGWDPDVLQNVLDQCDNGVFDVISGIGCDQFFQSKGCLLGTFDPEAELDYKPKYQFPSSAISPEAVTNIPAPPRGTCNGTLNDEYEVLPPKIDLPPTSSPYWSCNGPSFPYTALPPNPTPPTTTGTSAPTMSPVESPSDTVSPTSAPTKAPTTTGSSLCLTTAMYDEIFDIGINDFDCNKRALVKQVQTFLEDRINFTCPHGKKKEMMLYTETSSFKLAKREFKKECVARRAG